MNPIPTRQNEQREIERLAAKNFVYGVSDVVQWAQALFPVVNALVWPWLLTWKPNLKLWSGFCGFIIPLTDAVLLEPVQRFLRERGAKIQELFDCYVLEMDWNDLAANPKPTPECVHEAAGHFRNFRGNMARLANWYPIIVHELPIDLARIVCQRSNCWWDSKLRRRFAFSIAAIVSLAVILAFALGSAGGMTLEEFVLAIIAPSAPALIWGLRELKRQRATAADGDKMLQFADGLWAKGLSDDFSESVLKQASRDLQDAIFQRRKTSPVNPTPLYLRVRKSYESQMTKAAEEMVKEFRRTKGS
jgi:hypothetical protein